MKNKLIKLLGGYTKKDLGKYNAHLLNEFQLQTLDMPYSLDERQYLIPVIERAMKLLSTPTSGDK